MRLARDEFDTGMININGYGGEDGGFGMHEFVNVKAVMVN